ncbi:MAG: AAA family ATPase [Candidatus Neomarinimicrobiota bacterium]
MDRSDTYSDLMTSAKNTGRVKRPEIVVVTSGKGGVGKTFLSVNLSLLWRRAGKKVLLIDADFHLGNVDLLLGISPPYSIADVLLKKMELAAAIVNGPGDIDILPASSAEIRLLEMQDHVLKDLALAFEKFEHNYDVVVVDTGSGIGRDVLSFVLAADKAVVAVTPDPASITDAYAVIKVVKQTGSNVPLLLVANSTATAEEGGMLFNKMNLIVNKFLKDSIRYGGTIQFSPQIRESVRTQQPFVLSNPRSATTVELLAIIKNIEHTPVELGAQNFNLFTRLKTNRQHKIDTQK